MKPTMVVGKQTKPPKFTFVEWECPNCNYENWNKVKLEDATYALDCVNCGAEYEVKAIWSRGLDSKVKNT